MNNQDKQYFCEKGAADEKIFIDNVAWRYGLDIKEHPDKVLDKYATDMQIMALNGKVIDADLKHVETPFYKAGRYGCDPVNAVTFNHKDYIRYMAKYPEWSLGGLWILFWVKWEKSEMFNVEVPAVSGLWIANIHWVDEWIRNGELKCHEYKERKGGVGTNARYSWVIDLRRCEKREIVNQTRS